MHYKLFFSLFLFIIIFHKAQKNNPALSIPVTDEHFGIKIVDEYRSLENLKDQNTIDWMRSQTDYSNSLLSTIPNRSYYLEKRLELDKRQGYSISDLKITSNDKYFYLKRSAGEKTSKIYYRQGFEGEESLLYDPSNFNSNSEISHNYVINLISPSWDGNKIAISLTEKGKELSEVIIMDVRTKNIYPEKIINTNPSNIGGIKWLDDNSGFFYVYYPVIDITSEQFRKNTQSILYKIGEDPKKLIDVLSNSNNPSLNISREEFPAILAFNQNDKYYIGILVDAEDFRKTFIINKEDLLNGKNNWQLLYDKDSKVYSIKLVGDDVYFLSGYNSPNYKLCKVNIKIKNFKNPKVLIPEKKDEVITQYTLTKDGIYYTTTKNGIEAKLYLYKDGKEIPIKLPYVSGNISLQSKGKDFSDIWINCSGWANEEQRFKYDPITDTFKPENLAPLTEYPEFKDIIVEETTIKSYDGTDVPLSLIYNKNLKKDGKNPVLIQSYGAFGTSFSPFFARSFLVWASQGGILAIAHIRGGGEKGVQWHIDGQKIKKPNSWKDLIACTEYLIQKKYTSSKKVAIWGASAGGITIGRAMTERPDLYGAVIIEAGVLNTTRYEGIGETGFKEYGNPNNFEELKGLLEMDAYQHLKKGTKYPAALITSGINDPRVASWVPTKFAAKLLSYNVSENPILLKIDYEGGHGGDIPVIQAYSTLSDIFAFAFWQLGHPDYQPKKNIKK
ncbi:prolyl oligopeptidase family serine peptidase [Chryseobacterium cheonjiense]|uniref:prolyl oligopeptidase n=1 Tax=Chryseobacterium cheonjiense TaxID=2728845 RepID=A0A7Y0FJ79_9FLAO|nr:prolyl oligopeptidase family serine peptidase [Chryseobacterium cheonjiense]NML58269.1 prolyl oligopeptidase family serine peptidase [Chryseobacterium cheonjiense]